MLQLLKPKAKLILTPKDIKGETIDDDEFYRHIEVINEKIAQAEKYWITFGTNFCPEGKLLKRLHKECKRSGWNFYKSGNYYELCPKGINETLLSATLILLVLSGVGLFTCIVTGTDRATQFFFATAILNAMVVFKGVK